MKQSVPAYFTFIYGTLTPTLKHYRLFDLSPVLRIPLSYSLNPGSFLLIKILSLCVFVTSHCLHLFTYVSKSKQIVRITSTPIYFLTQQLAPSISSLKKSTLAILQ